MEKYTYSFANGEASEIEITEEWAEILADADRCEYNNNQNETRRHVSLETLDQDEFVFASTDNVELEAIRSITEQRLLNAMKNHLTNSQYDLIYSMYFLGISQQEYADLHGIDKATVSIMHDRAKNNLKKFLKNG